MKERREPPPVVWKLTKQSSNAVSASGWRLGFPATLMAIGCFMAIWSTINGCSLNRFSETCWFRTNHPIVQVVIDQVSVKNSCGNFEKSYQTGDSSWISVELGQNFTSDLLARWKAAGNDSETTDIDISGLDHKEQIELSAGDIHEFTFQAVDESGNPRRSGGDYFETDLTGNSWKSRPPVKDFGNGTYSISLQVHPNFSGEYNFTIILLFRKFDGLKQSTRKRVYDQELRRFRIRFSNCSSSSQSPDLHLCRESDFRRDAWSGRWTRHGNNESCKISSDGRYRCLNRSFPCLNPWCSGSLGSIESNGWVYSAHCSFKLFDGGSAWNCLKNRWVFFWGDSNHIDSIRNLLNFVLDLPRIQTIPRRLDQQFSNPKDAAQSVRITSIFNGHWNETQNYLGLQSLQNKQFRNHVKSYFSGTTIPDTVILNSGLHDGVFCPNVRKFAETAEFAANFWSEIMESIRERGLTPPQVFFRSTVAAGGFARGWAFNPSKMEAFNGVLVEKLKVAGVVTGNVIDEFDMTFPWHFDNRCSDGVHYGRAPVKKKWLDGQIGHQYFVDLMLVHVLLNAVCLR